MEEEEQMKEEKRKNESERERKKKEMMKYTLDHHLQHDLFFFINIAGRGDLQLLKLIHSRNNDLSCRVCNAAVWNGNFDCLQYIIQNGISLSSQTIGEAMSVRRMDVVRFLLMQEGSNEWILSANEAAEVAFLEGLKFVHERGCNWNEEVCTRAARRGRIGCLRLIYGIGSDSIIGESKFVASPGHEGV